jgi:hypothetical protein
MSNDMGRTLQDNNRHLEDSYLEGAAECIELARTTRDAGMRARLLALAQKWLHLAQYKSENASFLAGVEVFNNSRRQIQTRAEIEDPAN